MSSTKGFRITPQLLVGLFLVLLGVAFTLDNMGYANAGAFWEYWPLVLVAIGAVKWAQASTGPTRLAAGLWVLAGAWILFYNLEIIDYGFWDFWPLILVGIGGVIVWQTTHRHERREASADPASTVSAVCIWSGADRKSNSADFRGGELTAIMGGCEVDLRQARIADGEAVIDLFAFWGGIEIRVPADWSVVSHVSALMGGYEDGTKPPAGGSTQRLILRGLVVMGGVEVKN